MSNETPSPSGRGTAGRTRFGKIGTVIAAVAIAVGASLLVASPAQASCGTEGIHLSDPYLSGSEVHAQSFMDSYCYPSTSTVTLQRWRWWGWQDGPSATLTSSNNPILRWYCARSTFTYRQIATGRTVGGSPYIKKSAEVRITC